MIEDPPRGGRGHWWAALLLAGVVLLAAGVWAGRVTVTPAQLPSSQQRSQVVVTVRDGSIGRVLSLNVTVSQPFEPLAFNQLSGVVTSVADSTRFHTGDVLFRVDNIPVRVVDGTTPFYRDLTAGKAGKDVRELQRALHSLGLFSSTATGRFDAPTVAAVKAWQKSLGVPQTGKVRFGDLVAVPELPATLKRDDKIKVGHTVSGGEVAAAGRSGAPTFTLVVSAQQAALIPQGAAVDITFGDEVWHAVIAGSTQDPDSGSTVFRLAARKGGLPCGTDCGSLPADEKLTLLSRVHVVPKLSGPVIPAAAISVDAQGQAWVRLANGQRRGVTVKGSSDGLVVVGGLSVGARVLALANASNEVKASASGQVSSSAGG